MRRITYPLAILMVIILTLTTSCSLVTGSAKSSVKILRQSAIGTKWHMYQLELTLVAGGEMPVIIKLANGDVADGYYYVEKGDTNIAFQIAGSSPVYKSDLTNLTKDRPVSDRFTFTATQAQGTSYTITLRNPSYTTAKTKTTVFLEIIYPGDSPVFEPMNTK
jgi:hypothetical protein